MKKNIKKRVVSTLLVGLLFVSAGTVTKAAAYHNYDFFMLETGGADRSGDAKKEVSGSASVIIGSISTSAAPGRPLTMRVRKSSNDGKATSPAVRSPSPGKSGLRLTTLCRSLSPSISA